MDRNVKKTLDFYARYLKVHYSKYGTGLLNVTTRIELIPSGEGRGEFFSLSTRGFRASYARGNEIRASIHQRAIIFPANRS